MPVECARDAAHVVIGFSPNDLWLVNRGDFEGSVGPCQRRRSRRTPWISYELPDENPVASSCAMLDATLRACGTIATAFGILMLLVVPRRCGPALASINIIVRA